MFSTVQVSVVIIRYKYTSSDLVPLGFYCLQAMNDVGFRTKSIVVKNIEGNEVGKGRTNNLWRYRALRGGFYIFKHEYVLIFQKPRGVVTHPRPRSEERRVGKECRSRRAPAQYTENATERTVEDGKA